MDGITPAVTRLAVHEEGGHRVYLKNGTLLRVVRTITKCLKRKSQNSVTNVCAAEPSVLSRALPPVMRRA